MSLAVSLHAPNDALRETLVPLNKKYPIAELMASCARYLRANKRRESVTFEYTLMKGINDKPEHARELARLMRQFDNAVQAKDSGKVNLIPFNPFPGTRYERSEEANIRAFQKILLDSNVLTMVRRTRGDDIDAACGQLKGQVMDRTRRQAEFNKTLQAGKGAMPQPDRLWLVLCAGVLAVAVGGCKSHPKAKLGPSQAPVYSVGDPESVRREVRWRDLLTLATRDIQVGNLDAAERKVRDALKLAPEAPTRWCCRPVSTTVVAAPARPARTSARPPNWRRSAATCSTTTVPGCASRAGRPNRWSGSTARCRRRAIHPGEAQANAGSCALDAGQRTCRTRPACGARGGPANPVALESMAQLSYRQGRYMEARAFAERRIAAAPATRSVLQLASQIEVKLGDRAASDRYLQRIRQEFPQEAGSNSRVDAL